LFSVEFVALSLSKTPYSVFFSPYVLRLYDQSNQGWKQRGSEVINPVWTRDEKAHKLGNFTRFKPTKNKGGLFYEKKLSVAVLGFTSGPSNG